jgi:hypothetical protein
MTHSGPARISCLALALALVATTGCSVTTPEPTPVAPAARNQVEVVWANHSDQPYVVSIVGRTPEQQAFAIVEPCSAHNVIQFADPPFEIGLGGGAFAAEPQPTLVDSHDLEQPADGLYRIFVRIDAKGEVTSGTLLASQEAVPAQLC